MSIIEELSIQGIRSFGPNAEDRQRITFSLPLTLILGQNGCGKTTIIECLKYALTGDSPPGSDRGKSFVHDPKIFCRNETLGQIKLQARNKLGARMSLCRSMKMTVKRDKTSFETLDSTINYLNGANGDTDVDSLSRRCLDVDAAIIEFMGVSKPIINNVLFCHQEDSTWPLDEAKKLKEKFDAIFDITQHNKAIDKIIQMRKQEVDELKVMEANLKLLAHLKKDMEEKTSDLHNTKKTCESIEAQSLICDEEIKPIEARLSEILKIEYDVSKYQAQKVETETKHLNCCEQISSLDKKIKTHFTGTLSELEIEIRRFEQKMIDKRHECSNLEEKLSKNKHEEKQLLTIVNEFDKQICIAQQKHQKEQECKQQYINSTKTLCKKLNINFNADDVNGSFTNIQNVLTSKRAKLAELTMDLDVNDQKRQEKIDEIRVEVTKSEEGIEILQKQKHIYEKEINDVEKKVNDIEVSMHQLKILSSKIAETDDIYEETLSNFNQNDYRETITKNKNNIAELQKQFRETDEKLTTVNSVAKLTAEINLKVKEFEKKEQEVRRVKSKHSDNFSKVFPEPVVENYRRALQLVYEKVRREIKDLNEKSNAEKLKEQSYEIKRKQLKDEITRLNKEMEDCKEKVYEKCHAMPYEDLLKRSKAAVEKLQLDHGALKSAEAMFKKYMQKIKEEPCCPLCHRNMSNNEATDLSAELIDEIQKLPDNIAQTEKNLKIEQSKYEELLQMRVFIEKIERIKTDLPKRKIELNKVQNDLTETVSDYEQLQMLLAEPTIILDLSNTMMGDMSLLDEAMKEVARAKSDIDKLEVKLPADHDINISVEELQAEKNDLNKKLEAERKELEINQQTYEKQMEAINRIREMKNKLKDEQIKLQEGLQSLPQLKERQEELMKLLLTTAKDFNVLQTKLQPLKLKLTTAMTEKARLKDIERQNITQMQSTYNAYQNSQQDIKRIQEEVLDFKKMVLPEKLETLKSSMKSAKEKLNQMILEIAADNEKLNEIKAECNNQESFDRDLKDNRDLKQLQQKEIALSEQCKILAKQLGDLDCRSIQKEKNLLNQKREKVTVRKSELLGQLGELNNQIKKLQETIESPKYKESVQNYNRANYEAMVTRYIIDDLGYHRLALEWALIKFHGEKMEKINRLIREYWRLIYKGNDIDYIQIKTGDDDDIKTKTSADRKRSYKYRVMQSKNNVEIEMRGRCSAGQRVLASLIIRMALAETFSSNCGVLALDEPTANLDQQNIISLCDALNTIVQERQIRSNFMLIVITHDEDFISTLGKIDTYYRVFRNEECKSEIRKCK